MTPVHRYKIMSLCQTLSDSRRCSRLLLVHDVLRSCCCLYCHVLEVELHATPLDVQYGTPGL